MFIWFYFDIYKPNLEGMLVLNQDRIVKWKEMEKKKKKLQKYIRCYSLCLKLFKIMLQNKAWINEEGD